jgi:serine/threonine protein kinase
MSLTQTVFGRFDVIGFIAPEILRGSEHTAKADIYAFGMLMYEFAINKPVYYDTPHDAYLLDQIAHAGYRARLGYGMPESYAELLRACWSQNPAARPSVRRLRAILDEWHIDGIHDSQFRRAEKYRVHMLESRGFETTGPMLNPTIVHPQAIYTSRLLRFPVIPPNGRAPPRRRATADVVRSRSSIVSDQSK